MCPLKFAVIYGLACLTAIIISHQTWENRFLYLWGPLGIEAPPLLGQSPQPLKHLSESLPTYLGLVSSWSYCAMHVGLLQNAIMWTWCGATSTRIWRGSTWCRCAPARTWFGTPPTSLATGRSGHGTSNTSEECTGTRMSTSWKWSQEGEQWWLVRTEQL